jgi:NAD+ kinase
MGFKNILVVYTKSTSKEQEKTISLVKSILSSYNYSFTTVDRDKLKKIFFDDKDLIIAVGGDGTYLRASHYIFDKTPLLGVNSDPKFKEGFFMSCTREDFSKKFQNILEGKFKIRNLQRLEARIGKRKIPELALNEFYIASKKPYHTARYILTVRGKSERQKSSGVLVSSAAGSHAWVQSAGGKSLPIVSDKFEIIVREPYCGRTASKCQLVNRILERHEKIIIDFEVGEGIIIADSLSNEHMFKSGEKVVVKQSKNPLRSIYF